MKTALVIDDSKSARFAMRKYLESNDYEVLTAESPDEAFQVLSGTAPSVIFLDHIMPGVEGFSVLQKLKATPGTGALPVVVCSSNEGRSFVEQAIAHGATAVLQKPPSPEQMAEVLRQLPAAVEPPTAVAPPPEPVSTSPKSATPPPQPPAPRLGERLSQGVAGLREQLEQQVQQATRRFADEIAELQQQVADWRREPAPPALDPAAITTAVEQGLAQAERAWLPPLRRDVDALQARLAALEANLSRELSRLQQSLDARVEAAQATQNDALAALEQRLREAAAASARAGVEAAVQDAAARLSEQVTDTILAALGPSSQAG
jgi:CheY-like chemotaxis protein